MLIWIVNPFDPLPGEREQLGRYGFLARCLRQAGHGVVWWSSAFSHRFKRPVEAGPIAQAARAAGLEVRLLPAPPYSRNVSFARLRNHRRLALEFAAAAPTAPRPDLILASSPPLELAARAVELGRAWDRPTVVDIQDQWPDNFIRVTPRLLRPLSRLLFQPYYAWERRAYRAADAIVGVADGYVQRGLRVGGAKRWTGTFPLGVDLADVAAAMQRGVARYGDRWRKPPDQVWFLYSGSLSHAYDFLTIVRAAVPAQATFGDRVRFILTGTGELAPQAANLVARHGLRNVTLTGFLDFDEWACVLSRADVGFNASFPEALIYFPNKIFYYLAAGAAVLNTIPGQCAALVDRARCGLNYPAGDADACFAAVRRLVTVPDERRAMGAAARRLAEEVFDRRIVYTEMTRFLEQVARAARAPAALNGSVPPRSAPAR